MKFSNKTSRSTVNVVDILEAIAIAHTHQLEEAGESKTRPVEPGAARRTRSYTHFPRKSITSDRGVLCSFTCIICILFVVCFPYFKGDVSAKGINAVLCRLKTCSVHACSK